MIVPSLGRFQMGPDLHVRFFLRALTNEDMPRLKVGLECIAYTNYACN